MAEKQFVSARAYVWLGVALWTGGLNAQTCLALSPIVRGPNGTASANISLYSTKAAEPAALEWTLQFPVSSVSSVSVVDGPALASAGKIVVCAGHPGFSKCLITGANNRTIENGVIASLNIVVASPSQKPSIQIKSPLGVSPTGRAIPVSVRIMPAPEAHSAADCIERRETSRAK
jgi:hypothetical protein